MRAKKNVLFAAGLGIVLTVGAAGCGKETSDIESPVRIQDTSFENMDDADSSMGREDGFGEGVDETEENAEEDEETKDQADQQTDTKEKGGEPGKEAAGTEELTGNITSVGADSFVVSKVTTEHYEDYDLAVSAAPGSEQEELVKVYVDDSTVYTYKTVKNSGMHPEDITEQAGSYSDLKEGILVTLNGYWEDGSFHADNLVVMEFV